MEKIELFPLHAACDDENIIEVKRLISSDHIINEIDIKGQTALLIACRQGNLAIVFELLAAGADPNIRDNLGNTALLEAIKTCFGYDLLALHRDSDNSVDFYDTDINFCTAIRARSTQLVKLLLLHGANIHTQTNRGLTPIQVAKTCKYLPIISLLQIADRQFSFYCFLYGYNYKSYDKDFSSCVPTFNAILNTDIYLVEKVLFNEDLVDEVLKYLRSNRITDLSDESDDEICHMLCGLTNDNNLSDSDNLDGDDFYTISDAEDYDY